MRSTNFAKNPAGRCLTAFVLCWLTTSAGAERVWVDDDSSVPESNFSSVNKSVRVGDRAVVGDISTVNGAIRLGHDSQSGDVETVNGGVRAGSGAMLESLEMVNGTASLEQNVTVRSDVESVNGRIEAAPGTRIGGNVESVNGGIELDGVLVDGSVETYNGEIFLTDTEIQGDLWVKKSKNWGGWKKQKPTRVNIGAGTVIHGDLRFERAVALSIHKSAQVGRIIGDEVEMVGDSRMK